MRKAKIEDTKPAIQDAPTGGVPVYDLELVDPGNGNQPTTMKGGSLNPWGYEERIQMIADAGYDNNQILRAKAVIDRAFATGGVPGAPYSNFPLFSKANRLCVKVWIEHNPEPSDNEG